MKDGYVAARINPELLVMLKKKADKEGVSVSEAVRRAIVAYVAGLN